MKLVFDRTGADVERVKYLSTKIISMGWDYLTADEQAEWFSGKTVPLTDANGEQFVDANGEPLLCREGIQKGSYNYTDINRVGDAMLALADLLTEAGYSTHVHPRKFKESDFISPADEQYYLKQAAIIHGSFPLYGTTPKVPPMVRDYRQANDVEKILYDIDELLKKTQSQVVYAGEVFLGEVW